MKITPAILKTLRVEIDAALAEVAKRHGLTLHAGSASYTENRFSFKLEGVTEGAPTQAAERYAEVAVMLGLPTFGSEFRSGTRKYKTCGVNSTGSKVHCERDDGKVFLFPTDTCIALCKSASAS